MKLVDKESSKIVKDLRELSADELQAIFGGLPVFCSANFLKTNCNAKQQGQWPKSISK